MRKSYFHSRPLRALAMLAAMTVAATSQAQDKPSAPVNLRAEATYSLVTLSWQRSSAEADTLLSEGFEADTFPPEGWTITTTNTNDPSYTWFSFPTSDIIDYIDDWEDYVHSGERSAFVNIDMGAPYDDGTAGTQDEWLITPAVEGAAYLDFWCKIPSQVLEYGEDETFTNHYYVKVSHDGGATWKELWDGRADSNGSDGWQAVSLYLGDPADGPAMVAFHATSGSDDPDMSLFCTWDIDDVRLSSATAEGTPMESFYVYCDGETLAEGLKSLTFTDDSDKTAGEHLYEVKSYNSQYEQLSDAAEATVYIQGATTNAPTNLRLSYTYDEESQKYNVQMAWDAPEGERTPAYYTAYCNNAMFGDWLEECSVEQTGLSKGVYNYSVVAVYEYPDGESEAVGDQVALGTRYPARDITVTPNGDGSFAIAWKAPKESEYTVNGYKLFCGTTLLAEQAETAYTEAEPAEGNHDYSVKAVYDDGFESVAVTVNIDNGDMPVYELPFSEDFTGGLKPGNWSVTKNRSGLKDNYLWRFDNWYELPVSGGGFDTDFASANSSSAGLTNVNTTIITPPLTRKSIGDNERTYLEFDMDYKIGGKSYAYIAYSTDNGENWTDLVDELQGYSDDDLAAGATCQPQHLAYDVTALFDDSDEVMIAWTYNGKSAQHIAIDNVRVSNADPTAIGRVVATTPSYSYAGGTLKLTAQGIRRVQVYRPDGTLVADTRQATVPIAARGLYIIRVSAESGEFTIKARLE